MIPTRVDIDIEAFSDPDEALLRKWGYKTTYPAGYWVNPQTGSYQPRARALIIVSHMEVLISSPAVLGL